MAIEVVDLPIKNGDVPLFFVSLPESNQSISLLLRMVLSILDAYKGGSFMQITQSLPIP